jgi:hypothetical protein
MAPQPSPAPAAPDPPPAPARQEPLSAADSGVCATGTGGPPRWRDVCADVAAISADFAFELLERYHSLLTWYQPVEVIDSNFGSDGTPIRPIETLPLPVTVVITVPDPPFHLPPGLEYRRSGLPFSAEREPHRVRPDSPSVAHSAAPGRAPPARGQTSRAATWRPPALAAAAEAAAPTAVEANRPRRPGAQRDSDVERQPEPRPPLSEWPLAGTAGIGGASGSAGSAGGSSGGAGSVLAALLLVFALAVLDLLRRLRLELARPRSEHIDSFPERPG